MRCESPESLLRTVAAWVAPDYAQTGPLPSGPPVSGHVDVYRPSPVPGIADIQILDVSAVVGMFDALLICHPPAGAALVRLLDRGNGWHTDAFLAKALVRWERERALTGAA